MAQGAVNLTLPKMRIKAGFEMSKASSRQEFIRVRINADAQGEQELEAYGNQGSSIMTSLSWADGLAEIPTGETVSRGQALNFFPFKGML